MGMKDQMNKEDICLKTIVELESISGKPILEIKKAISDEKLLHSLRGLILPWLKNMLLSHIRERNYPFTRGQQHMTHLLFLKNILIWNCLVQIQKGVKGLMKSRRLLRTVIDYTDNDVMANS